jgi:hypothetical protein
VQRSQTVTPKTSQFAYLCVAIRRFYRATVRWGARLLSVASAILIYVLNTAFMTAVLLPPKVS